MIDHHESGKMSKYTHKRIEEPKEVQEKRKFLVFVGGLAPPDASVYDTLMLMRMCFTDRGMWRLGQVKLPE